MEEEEGVEPPPDREPGRVVETSATNRHSPLFQNAGAAITGAGPRWAEEGRVELPEAP